ncbi:alpha/beta hydrolase [Flexithrix dorotheae]|uniref:alpha/beta hydrolase n=1 Tax=Flexithrix dorotheae TaxID=70993 RepID=UPI00036EC814|nr:alpha/beta hydrolase [Flexithrix dorotheae]
MTLTNLFKGKTSWIITFVGLILPITLSAQHLQNDYKSSEIISLKHWLDLDYVGDRHIGHRLDIHLPDKESDKYPVVISIYGSAWFSNNSKGATFAVGIGQALLKAGYAVVTINHRASSDAKFPAQIQDVKAAVRFVRANALAFSLDTSFIGITGWSSGGHLSAFAGTSNNITTFEFNGNTIDIEGSLGNHTSFSSQVDAVVDWFGPTNFLVMDNCGSTMKHDNDTSPESSLVGGAIQSNKNKCHLADPVTYISKNATPFLIIHGDKDPLVPFCQSEYLYEKLNESDIYCEFITVEGGKHGPGVLIPEYLQQMISFFDKIRIDK